MISAIPVFEDIDKQAVIVNLELYIDMLRRSFNPAIQRKRAVEMNVVVLQ